MPSGRITIYKGDQVMVIDINDLFHWVASGWSMDQPASSAPPPSGGGDGGGSSGGGSSKRIGPFPGESSGGSEPPPSGGPTSHAGSDFMQNDSVVFRFADGTFFTYGELAGILASESITSNNPQGRMVLPPPGTMTRGEFQREFGDDIRRLFSSSGGDDEGEGFDPNIGIGGSGGGGGRGGGASGPTYIKPDERLVRDAVEARLVALTGVHDEARIDALTETYMSEHKRAFNKRETEQIDPMRTVTEKIEGSAEYKAVHQLRPESEDPMQWIASRQGSLLRAGVSVQRSNDQAIQQATIAATDTEAARAGEFNTFNATGRLLPGFFQNVQNSARSALQLL